ncbi:enoyl-CoA hydratase/isomerase family protein [Marivibrio halodurans]|uniref:Enoyl-CoA hydratase/isomerase family protein n=1 Tax=Marivibrio halodurans TaxID=2039722 RepID=A0A8J7SJ71_9PROT|nr:3-hydroxyacyl-CoA dehydrogenase NAD-binding domain-containing protein [Marivibrio halodurans]MBP5857528.1 enoyl-CoA hydratase/isomerase family protein [Marivibrio halodurans]
MTDNSTQNTPSPISIEMVDDIALVAIDNPPVNASSQAVREGLKAAFERLAADPAVKAIALYAKGRTFIAGADIKEFGKPPRDPSLPEVCATIEGTEKPVIAVLHGTALGGGLEIALAAHARIALPGTKIGLPEVNLGILPGAGGTQRAPRLAGIRAALDMITSGRHVPAGEAKDLGLLDRIEEGEPRDIALAMAKKALAGSLPTRRTSELSVTPDDAAVEEMAETLKRTQPRLFSPHKCVEAVAASTRPFAEGVKRERALFLECMESPQRAGLIHAFFAERAVARIPEKGAEPRAIASTGVIGAGTMGAGIATALLLAGLPVTLVERDQEALDRGRATIEGNLAAAVERGKLSEEKRAAILAGALTPTTDMEALSTADLVIEAAFEDMAVKREIFTTLDRVAKPGAMLATNTSYLDIDEIAAVTGRPADVIGLHFFSPAHIMRLLEVVVAQRTAAEVVATGFALAKKLRKVAVRAGVCDGFIGNRILAHYRKAADYLVMDGAMPEEVDRALTGFGMAMGPFAVSDMAGLDIGWAARKRQAPTRPADERYVPIADRICEQGWFGRKTGRGYYLHPEGGKPTPNTDVAEIIRDERGKAGISPRTFTEEEIVARFTTAMIAEATRVLEDGIALRPIDIDAVLLFGYGFPRFRGGPMHHADTVGAAELVRRIESYAGEDAHFWRVPDLLRRMAEEGHRFADMNEG